MISTNASAGAETLLSGGQRLVFDTEIGNHFVTWSETSGNGLHIYDLNTNQVIDESKIINYNWAGVGGSNVEVYNNYAVWCDMDGNIRLYDSATNTATQIDTSGDNPLVNANKVVYEKNGNICVYDIGTKGISQFSSQGMYISDLSGNKVVGTISNSGKSNVYIADINTKQMSLITTNGHAGGPQINGNIVVWTDYTTGQSDIYMRDISTKTITKVSSDKHSSDPRVYGNRIVYTSAYTQNGVTVSNIYMYDKSTKKITQITNSGTARYPSIYGDNIIYEDYKNEDTTYWEEGGIYLYNLASTPSVIKPVAAFTASKTYSSTHPATITFTYSGTGTTPITCKWIFGDGKSESTTSKTISHKYTGKGVYTVSVTATNKAGSGSLTKKNYITVK